MARPRIEGWEDRMLSLLVKRGVFKSYGEALRSAVKLLLQDQMRKEASKTGGSDESMEKMQWETLNESVGSIPDQPTVAPKRKRS